MNIHLKRSVLSGVLFSIIYFLLLFCSPVFTFSTKLLNAYCDILALLLAPVTPFLPDYDKSTPGYKMLPFLLLVIGYLFLTGFFLGLIYSVIKEKFHKAQPDDS